MRGEEAIVLPPSPLFTSSFHPFPHFQRQRVVPICLSFVMIFIQSLKANAAQRRIFTCISASDLHHHLFCNFFMFGISCRDSLGSLCSFHLSFCESFSSLLCESFSSLLGESFICIVMAWFFQALSLFYYSKFAILVEMPIPEFLRSYLIVSGDTPYCLNFDIRWLRYCNGPFVASLYWPFVASGFFG